MLHTLAVQINNAIMHQILQSSLTLSGTVSCFLVAGPRGALATVL